MNRNSEKIKDYGISMGIFSDDFNLKRVINVIIDKIKYIYLKYLVILILKFRTIFVIDCTNKY
jgi:hypothetical protein